MTDWPVKTLGEVCEIYQPQTIGLKDMVLDGRYVVYGANGPIGHYDRFNHENSEVTVTCRGATCGTVNVTPPQVWITGNAMVVRPNEAELSKLLLKYWLECLDYSSIITGAAQPQITRTTLSPMMIPVPPLEEQKRIVELLDAATARVTELTACYEQARTHANNLFTSALRDALESNPDWPVKTLGEMLELSYGKPLDAKDRDDNSLIPVYGANGVKAYSKKSLIAGPSIIVGRKGSAGELNFCQGPFWPLDVTYYVEHDANETDLSFLYYLLLLMDLPSLAKGVKPGINRNDVYALQATEPPLDEQKRIVARLDSMRVKTSEMVAAYDAKLSAAKNLRQSILEAAFAGDL